MLPQKKVIPSKKHSQAPNTLVKGFTVLQNIAGRVTKIPEWRLHSTLQSLNKVARVQSQYYRKMSEDKDVYKSSNSGFASQVEELRNAFLKRPGCPRFNTRSTSMSQYGMTVAATLSRELGIRTETWKMTEDTFSGQQGLDTNMDGSLLPLSKSACEFNYLRRRSKSQMMSSITAQTNLRKKLPWYISIIHEKDNCLFMLCEEVQRLSELEVQSRKKDEEILVLREEMEALKKQLKSLLKGNVWEMPASPGLQEDNQPPYLDVEQLLPPGQEDRSRQSIALEQLQEGFEALSVCMGSLQELSEAPATPEQVSIFQGICGDNEEEELLLCWKQMQEGYLVEEKGTDLEGEGGDKEEEDQAGAEEQVEGAGAGKKEATQEAEYEEQEAGEKEKEEKDEEEEVGLVEDLLAEEGEEEIQIRRMYSLDEAFEDELMARLEEYEQVVQEIQSDLETTRSRYLLATGAMTSLQRQVEFQESQLKKINTENEMLKKELLERKHQLQAMSNKFSNLREGRKHEEMMGLIEKDNFLLRQQVMELERGLKSRDQIISEYDTKVQQLQDQVNLDQNHLQRWEQLQEVLQSKAKLTQQAEEQARVALESTQSRLERLRNKIIQATFGSTGVKSLATELSDNDLLEALQRTITERSDFYNQLKQKGVKVPPLNQSDGMLSSPSKPKKVSSK
ncbi:PREDICTED: coiled-coil domain-containing protein 27 [Chrysochloris asiatica]|uniref:Coiled-coil domain-containing protein 27 n=1 Tax=Chrysochloris asiatica TaxID=185453 RepID=A0A9B0WX07_CHRAS|nr:PREDICTED: coiled-coil domain-containing protein 27 [Chrysochloris asiatica]